MINLIIVVLILLGGAFRDGISERAEKVGWLSWHVAGWIARDLVALLIAIQFALQHRFYEVLIVAFIATGHEQFYLLGVEVRSKLTGPIDPPRWFLKLRKLWTWLPWA